MAGRKSKFPKIHTFSDGSKRRVFNAQEERALTDPMYTLICRHWDLRLPEFPELLKHYRDGTVEQALMEAELFGLVAKHWGPRLLERLLAYAQAA